MQQILFYSDYCKHCKIILNYINDNNINLLFKFINIDKEKYPKFIKVVPTLINLEFIKPLEGKDVFKYIYNIKYFNNPTNNITFNLPLNPNIKYDNLAQINDTNYYIFK
jgi:hypothetical protein